MVKRVGNLWDKVISMDNLTNAYKNARRGKGNRKEVMEFDKDIVGNLNNIRQMLIDGTYKTSKYHNFSINDRGKVRNLSALPFYPDRIIHWAIMLVTQPIFMRNYISQTYAAIPERGTHKALRTLKRYLRNNDAIYCLKLDIKQFFPSIDKNILMNKLERRFKDKQVLDLFKEIVYGYEGSGLPIGNYTSQHLANFYLSDLDHFMKEKYHAKYYLRYMDDIIILGWSKAWLRRAKNKIQSLLTNIDLELKGNWQIYPINVRGVDFVGYRSFKEYTLLRTRTKHRMKRKTKAIIDDFETGNKITPRQKGQYDSYSGILLWCDSHRLSQNTLYIIGEHLDNYDDS